MPSSAIHVLWLCRKPCGVSPSLAGSQHASGASSAGVSPLPGQWSPAVLWALILPGHAVAFTTTSRPGLLLAGGCRPSQAGRKNRRA